MEKEVSRFHCLDGMRGFLALSVAASHTFGSITGYAAGRPVEGAYLAVDFFFLLSGFVLTHMQYEKSFSVAELFLRRFARLWPLHAVMTLLVFAIYLHNRAHHLYVTDRAPLDVRTLIANLSMLSDTGLVHIAMLNDPAWSIGVEFWLSALLLYWLTFLKPRTLLVFGLLCYVLIAANGRGLELEQEPFLFVNLGFMRGVAGIVLGSALYRLRGEFGALFAHSGRWIAQLLVHGGVGVLTYAIWTQGGPLLDLVAILAALPFFLMDESALRSPLMSLLQSGPFQWLGKVSYSVYLVHTPLLLVLGVYGWAKIMGPWQTAACVLALVLIAASLTELLIEMPLRKLFMAGVRVLVKGAKRISFLNPILKPSPHEKHDLAFWGIESLEE